jgi:hypothetical protein
LARTSSRAVIRLVLGRMNEGAGKVCSEFGGAALAGSQVSVDILRFEKNLSMRSKPFVMV